MILMSNHSPERGLLSELRENTLQAQQDKLYLLKKEFDKVAKEASQNGKSGVKFILVTNKFGKNYLNEVLLKDFKLYLIGEGFSVGDWQYIEQTDICEPFYAIDVNW